MSAIFRIYGQRGGRTHYERRRDKVLVESQLEPMAQRFWGVEEFAFALRAAGFDEVAIAGDYDRARPPRPTARVLAFEAARS
ncbi:MAG TPA: hypothetical protein VG166_15490 [Caulobacteraceae bacterium]|nr:hypothetical protein [Caulobacteraceae bacterium]